MAKYSEEFKQKCKEVYPEWKELHALLDKNAYFAGRYLGDNADFVQITVDDIIKCKDLEDFKKLRLKAAQIKARKQVYVDWWVETECDRSK